MTDAGSIPAGSIEVGKVVRDRLGFTFQVPSRQFVLMTLDEAAEFVGRVINAVPEKDRQRFFEKMGVK